MSLECVTLSRLVLSGGRECLEIIMGTYSASPPSNAHIRITCTVIPPEPMSARIRVAECKSLFEGESVKQPSSLVPEGALEVHAMGGRGPSKKLL